MANSLQTAAKAGDTKALESLMNKSFEAKGITVRVTNTGSVLKILLRSAETPDRQLASTIKQGLNSIGPQGFDEAFVTARANHASNGWTEQWSLGTPEVAPTPAADPAAEAASPIDAGTESDQPAAVDKKAAGEETGSGMDYLLAHHKKHLIGVVCVGVLGLFKIHVLPQALQAGGQKSEPKSEPEPTLTTTTEQLENPAVEVSADTPAQPAVEPEPPPPTTDQYYELGLKLGYEAATGAQTARSQSEWDKVTDQWDSAINALEDSASSKSEAKLAEYRQNRQYALGRRNAAAAAMGTGINAAEFRVLFSQAGLGISFENSPLNDGRSRLLGTSYDKLAIVELIGPSNNVSEATLMTFVGQGMSDSQIMAVTVYMLLFVKGAAPTYDLNDWMLESLEDVVDNPDRTKRIKAGSNVVELSYTKEIGTFSLSVKPE